MATIDPALHRRLGEAEPFFGVAMEAATQAQKVMLTMALLRGREHLTFVTPKSGFYVKLF